MSVGFAILIIGIPFFLLFIGATRGLALVEGRIVEAMLGTRMPRRPLFPDRETPWLTRIVDMLKDPRTWGTIVYLLLMLPLGIFYFVFAVVGLTVSLGTDRGADRDAAVARSISSRSTVSSRRRTRPCCH